jgi:hypothetical protein
VDDIELGQLERDLHRRITRRAEGYNYEGRATLGISMPLKEIVDFKLACDIKGIPWRVAGREKINEFTNEVKELGVRFAKEKAKFYTERYQLLEKLIAAEGSQAEAAIVKAVNECVKKLELTKTAGRYSHVVENVSPINFTTFMKAWSDLPKSFKDSSQPDYVRLAVNIFEERLKNVENDTVRETALRQLEHMKHKEYPMIFGEEPRQRVEDLKGKSSEELIQMDRARQDDGVRGT